MGVDVGHSAGKAARRVHKQVVVSAHDSEPAGMRESGSIGHAICGGQDVTIIKNDSITVDHKGRVNGTGGGILSRQSSPPSCGERGDFIVAVST